MSTKLTNKEPISNYLAKGLLFLLSPIISLVSSILTLDKKSSTFYIGCFGILWCFVQSAYAGKAWMDSYDIDAYRLFFEEACYQNSHDYFQQIRSFFSLSVTGERIQDLYSSTVLFLISRFTHNYHVFFALTGAVVCYFMIKSFSFIQDTPHKKNFIYGLLVFCFFFLHSPLYWIGGLRWITAAWIAIYAIFQIIIGNNKKYYLLLLITPFVHFSFWIIVFVVIIARLTTRFESVWFGLLLFSFALQVTVSSLYERLLQIQDSIPLFSLFKLGDMSLFEEGKEAVQELSFIKRLFRQYLAPFFPSVCCLFCYYHRKSFNAPIFKRMLSFLIVLTFFFNIFSVIPDLGRRLGWIIYPFLGYLLSSYFRGRKYIFIWIAYICSFAYILLAELFKGPWSLRTDLIDVTISPVFSLLKYL